MKKTLIFPIFLLGLCMVLFSACRSEFEAVRTSNDPIKILEAANKYYADEDFLKAQQLYELVIPFYRGRQEAEDIAYKFAYCHYYLGEYILASHYFKSFTTTFYSSDLSEEAEFMSAYSNYEMSPSHRLDQTYSEKAIDAFQVFVNKFPTSSRVEECNRLIDEMRAKLEKKAYEEGILYYNLKNYEAAMRSFSNLLNEYPESGNAEEVNFLIFKSSVELADNSIYSKKENRYKQAIEQHRKFIRKYPESRFKAEANDLVNNMQKALQNFKS